MPGPSRSVLPSLIDRQESELLTQWVAEQSAQLTRTSTLKESELRDQSAEFLRAVRDALRAAEFAPDRKEWDRVRDLLTSVSRSRAAQGFTPIETAMFVFSLKKPVFGALRRELGKDQDALADEVWNATVLLDRLGLFTTEVSIKTREEVIARQQEEMLELSTPVVKLWDGILALPMIGTLDSNRTQVVMQTLLQAIVDTGSQIAIVDITGVPTVDTLVAQHLLKTVAAARLMGAECIISGIRPQIAQTIVHLGIDLGDVITKASLADAFRAALDRIGAAPQASARG